MKPFQSLIFLFVSLMLLQACVYRMDIPQGNRIDKEKIEQLKIGMTRSQVIFLLGEAAINDQHHANKSHYVNYLYRGDDRASELKTMTLSYDNDILTNIEGELQ